MKLLRKIWSVLVLLAFAVPGWAANPSVLHHQMFTQTATGATGTWTLTSQPTIGNFLLVFVASTGTVSAAAFAVFSSAVCKVN